ncbi:MAG: gliding motility lipoprotein GldD [Bacteroidales bacterium]|nr:gliding motility lipoprotein GldD [Bacteroidales bacterium]
MSTARVHIALLALVATLLTACGGGYAPKPRGYYRIDFPEKHYRPYDSTYPFRCNLPVYASINPMGAAEQGQQFLNIDIKRYNARIHLTYMDIHNNLDLMIEDAFAMAYKHTQKADAIDEKTYIDEQKRVYGLLYDIKGNSASSVQFFLTDSLRHYIRGALYFNCRPNKDSLAPVVQFVRDDIVELMESWEWK